MWESVRARLKPLAMMLAAVATLLAVGWLVAYAPALVPGHERSVQAEIIVDSQHPTHTLLVLNVQEGLPLFQSYRDQRMTCAGVSLPYGFMPYQTIGGYYGEVPSVRPGAAIHCVFHDWQGTAPLELTTSTCVPPMPALTSPAAGSSVSLSTNLAVTFSTYDEVHSACGEQHFFPTQARDTQGHYALFHSGGIGPTGVSSGDSRGHAAFFPVGWRGVLPGPGALYFETPGMSDSSGPQPGWREVSELYHWSASFPVTWV